MYKPFSKYPHVSRDISISVPPGVTGGEVERVIQINAPALLLRVSQIDDYHRGEFTSYTFRLVFQSMEKSLTDMEVNKELEKVTRAIFDMNWVLR